MTTQPTADFDKEKVLSKVQKLLNMANGTAEGGEHERDTAMKMALKLLAKHNLEMSDTATTIAKEKRMTATYESFPCPWRRSVAQAIGQLFFCKMFFEKIAGKQKHLYTFIGLESNVITARDMVEWLIKSVTKECRSQKKAHNGDHAWETSFFNGCGIKIVSRCFEMRAAEEASSLPATGTALVLASVYKQEEEANLIHIAEELGIKLRTGKAKSLGIKDIDGYRQGQEFGANVNLGRQLT